MAGQKLAFHLSTIEDGVIGEDGAIVVGLPMVETIENGNVEPDDEQGLFRLTDDGLWAYYEIGCEMAAGIMSLSIEDKPAVQEIARFNTEEEAVKARGELSQEEQHRTLLRSVKPKNH